MVGGDRPRDLIITGNKTYNLPGIKRRVDHNRGNAGVGCLFHRGHQGAAIKRREYNALYIGLNEASYDLDLLFMVALAPGAFPCYIDRNSMHLQIVRRFIHPGMNRLPVPMR